MNEETIKKITKYFLNELNIKEIQIKEHRNHDLMLRCLRPKKVKNRFIMIIYFECLDCKEKWKHSIQDSKNYLTLLYKRLCNFLHGLQQNEVTRFESEMYNAIKSEGKNNKDEGLEISKYFFGNNKKLKDDSKGNYEIWAQIECHYCGQKFDNLSSLISHEFTTHVDPREVDLHGLYVKEAILKVKETLIEYYELGCDEITLIHGYRHGHALKDYFRSDDFIREMENFGFRINLVQITDLGTTGFSFRFISEK